MRIKNFEVRLNDRDYKVRDILNLREWNPNTKKYSGLYITREVKCILDDPNYCKDGYVILGIE
jgi:hypothetical protein